MEGKLELQPKNRLKRPLKVKCFKCSTSFEVKYNPGQGGYAKKNNWGYWTEKEEYNDKWICDKDLIHLYKNDRWEYLENITNLARRRVLRTYIYEQKLGVYSTYH